MIMTLSELKDYYADRAKRYGSVFLLRPKDALAFMNDGVTYGFILEGVEGFKITSTGACQPSQDHSNDFADSGCNQTEFIKKTQRFVADRAGLDIWFEVVFSG
mgnify:CR=1 FL=1